MFRFNNCTHRSNNTVANTSSGTGIVNLGGQVQCSIMECLPVCVACVAVPSQMPTKFSPVPHPTVPEHVTAPDGTKGFQSFSIWLVAAAGVSMAWFAVAIKWQHRSRGHTRCGFGRTSPTVELPYGDILSGYQRPLLGHDDQTIRESESIELVESAGVMMSYEHSPAPIFVVGRNRRIIKWSPGMEIAAPMLVDPVGMCIPDLPFVNSGDGDRFDKIVRRIFEAPAEHAHDRTFILHLTVSCGHVLLEMRADHLVTQGEPIVVMTGRQLESDLACMMAQETTVAGSESKDDANIDYNDTDERSERFRSVSEEGSIKGDNSLIYNESLGSHVPFLPLVELPSSSGEDGCDTRVHREAMAPAEASDVSSLTMPTLSAYSKMAPAEASDVSSLTMPTLSAHSKVSIKSYSTMSSLTTNSGAREMYETLMREREINQTMSYAGDDEQDQQDSVDNQTPEQVSVGSRTPEQGNNTHSHIYAHST